MKKVSEMLAEMLIGECFQCRLTAGHILTLARYHRIRVSTYRVSRTVWRVKRMSKEWVPSKGKRNRADDFQLTCPPEMRTITTWRESSRGLRPSMLL